MIGHNLKQRKNQMDRDTYIKAFIEVLNRTVENNHVNDLYKILSELMTKEEWKRWKDCGEF